MQINYIRTKLLGIALITIVFVGNVQADNQNTFHPGKMAEGALEFKS